MERIIQRIFLASAALLMVLALGACGKKTQPIVSSPSGGPDRTSTSTSTDQPAPSVELSVSPSTVQRGESATLSWSSDRANSVVIDGGVGNVANEGSVSVSPLESTTYTATARNTSGDARSSARLTVMRDEGGEVVSSDIRSLQQAIEEGLVQPVFFQYDSSVLSAEARATLEENARWFRRYPEATIILEGHCDERGTEEYNLALGDRRAESTKDYLVQLGVTASRLETISFGEERPFVQGSNEAAWAKNRRAHFVVR